MPVRDASGRFISPVKLVKKTPRRSKPKTKKLVNQVCFIIDRSSSMQGLRNDVVRVFNEQAKGIRENAKKFGQETRVSLVTFSTEVDSPVFFNEKIESLGDLTPANYRPEGWTALNDAVGDTMQRLERTPGAHDDETSFLLIIITDGEENKSARWNSFQLGEYIKKVTATDRWTVTYLIPPTARKELFHQLYIPDGNLQRWEATTEGIRRASGITLSSVGSYYSARSAGATSVKSFFSPNLNDVNRSDLRANLDNVTSKFKAIPVTRVQDIRSFVEDQGLNYVPGNAFYELTKKEKVQDYKEFAIRDGSGTVYKGNKEARELMGLPTGGTIELWPGQHKNYGIFVQSTSLNRKLIPGTNLLVRVK